MSKIKDVLKKKAELFERKARKAALTTAVAATSVLGMSTTSCSTSEKKSELEIMKDQLDQSVLERQKEAQDLLKRIEESGIPVVKKDADGRVTEVLTEVKIPGYFRTEVLNHKGIHHSLGLMPAEKMTNFTDPKYMPVDQPAYTEDLPDGSQIKHGARTYQVTPKDFDVRPVSSTQSTKKETFEDKIALSEKDTLTRETQINVKVADGGLHFNYQEKTQENGLTMQMRNGEREL